MRVHVYAYIALTVFIIVIILVLLINPAGPVRARAACDHPDYTDLPDHHDLPKSSSSAQRVLPQIKKPPEYKGRFIQLLSS